MTLTAQVSARDDSAHLDTETREERMTCASE
jgi:hypothetical protein